MSVTFRTRPGMRNSRQRARLDLRGMKIRELLVGVEVRRLRGPADVEIRSIAYDSRKAMPGALFFALRGEKFDGIEFAGEAIRHGAVAVAGEGARPVELPEEISWVDLMPGSGRRGLARAAANLYAHPVDALKLVGVTGTNGKTTTAFLVDSILCAAGLTTGLLTTTGYRTPQGRRAAPNTTPESPDLQELFAEVRDARGTHATLEASSHALDMGRLWGCHFAAAIFTNLTRDHLDYHKSFADYFTAKRRLFEGTGAGAPDVGIVNGDDPYGSQLAGLARRTLTYGLKTPTDLTAQKLTLNFSGLEFTAQTPVGDVHVRSSLVGRMNVYNILAAIGAGIALGVPVSNMEAGISHLALVPGRFERVDEGQPFLVVVDYAHTDDALRNLITTARELNSGGRIITVFGAGGERDRTKRPLMGDAAGSVSDLVVVTSDNPRSEDPFCIINDVVVGLQRVNAKYQVEPDRERAIALALEEAKAGDIVLLAGKGHETYQVLRDGTIDFDDREKARATLRKRGFARETLAR